MFVTVDTSGVDKRTYLCLKLFTEVGKRTSVLVGANTTSVLLSTVVREAEEQATCDELLLCAHQILAKLAQKGTTNIIYNSCVVKTENS